MNAIAAICFSDMFESRLIRQQLQHKGPSLRTPTDPLNLHVQPRVSRCYSHPRAKVRITHTQSTLHQGPKQKGRRDISPSKYLRRSREGPLLLLARGRPNGIPLITSLSFFLASLHQEPTAAAAATPSLLLTRKERGRARQSGRFLNSWSNQALKAGECSACVDTSIR